MKTEDEPIDIFLWANQTDAIKNELDIEVFLFNKNYTPYTTNIGPSLDIQIKPLFLFGMLNFITLGAGVGLSIRDYEQNEPEENVLLTTKLENVGRAETLLHLIENEKKDIVEFSADEHEFKRVKGIVVRFRHLPTKKVFHVIKTIEQGKVLQGATAWSFEHSRFDAFTPDAALKMSPDNHVLVVDGQIFIFDTKKFAKLFDYDYKRQLLLDRKIAEIEKHFKLSFPDGLDMRSIAHSNSQVAEKILRCDPTSVTYEKLIDQADTFGLALMVDDAGAIIIMDGRDAKMFVNLLNDDYVDSDMTGTQYLAVKKQEISEDKQLNMGV